MISVIKINVFFFSDNIREVKDQFKDMVQVKPILH